MSWEESINRGTLALAKSDYATAESAFKHALETALQDFTENDERLSQTRSFLGQTYYKQGDHHQAQSYLSLSISSNPESNQDVLRIAVDHLSLAQMNYVSGQATDAHEHFSKALSALTSTSLKIEQPLTSTAELEKLLNNAKKRQAEKTNASFKQLLVTAQKNHLQQTKAQEYFGTEPDAIVDAWQNLIDSGSAMSQKNDLDSLTSAFQNLNSAVRIALSIFQCNHQNIGDSIAALAYVAAKLELCEDAIALYNEALRIIDHKASPAHKRVMLKLNVANFYSTQFDYQTAIEFLTEATDLVQQTESLASAEHIEISNTLFTLMQKADIHRSAREMIKHGIECEENDRLEQANFYFENSLALLKKIFGESHLEVAQILMFKANILRKLNQKCEAETAQNQATQIESQITTRAMRIEQLRTDLPAIRFTK